MIFVFSRIIKSWHRLSKLIATNFRYLGQSEKIIYTARENKTVVEKCKLLQKGRFTILNFDFKRVFNP